MKGIAVVHAAVRLVILTLIATAIVDLLVATRVMLLPLLVLLCLASAFAFPTPFMNSAYFLPFCSTKLLLSWASPP